MKTRDEVLQIVSESDRNLKMQNAILSDMLTNHDRGCAEYSINPYGNGHLALSADREKP